MSAARESAVELYLDELLAALRGPARDVRRALAECEAHLRETVEQLVSDGCTEDEAARQATARFGDPRAVAAGFNRANGPARRTDLLLAVTRAGWQLIGVGFTAIGISGVVAWIAMQATSTAAVFADPPGTSYSAGACSYWLRLHPTAGTCARAALLEGRDDALVQRCALGVLGLLILLAAAMWKHQFRRRPTMELGGPTALVAVTVFGLAGVLLTGYGIDRAVQNTGAGQWLASGAVALVVAALYLVNLWQRSPALLATGERGAWTDAQG